MRYKPITGQLYKVFNVGNVKLMIDVDYMERWRNGNKGKEEAHTAQTEGRQEANTCYTEGSAIYYRRI